MSNQYDIVVLGGGTGGYMAAIRAAQLGRKVAIVEKDKIGGTCLHSGCIPSKSLLRSAEVLHTVRNSDTYGITVADFAIDFAKVQGRKQAVVDQMYKGVQYLMKKNKIDVYTGNGRVIGPSIFSPQSGAVAVEMADGEAVTLVPDRLIIATGSRPRSLPGLPIDGVHVMSSDHALRLETLPKSLLIVGGGVIGVEWASMMNDFGVEVTVVEYADRLIPSEDEDVSKELERQFRKRGIRILTGAAVVTESLRIGDGVVTIEAAAGTDGKRVTLEAEKLLLCVGRQANVENLGLENTDVKIVDGVIQVNAFLQTSESHIYAIGDVTGGLQLAHVASHEGIAAVEHIAGERVRPLEPHLVSRCTYSRPEIASIGWTERQARDKGYETKTGSFTFKATGKAQVYGDSGGFVKVIADRNTNDILGVHMIGPHATDLISEAALAQVLDATPWEVGRTIHPHPTLSEALGEAMLAVDGNAFGM